MNNIIFELKNIVDEGKKQNLSPELIRTEIKEYLQIFILDFIYNSPFKVLNFYGGSCLRIIYDLNRMSEDLDFEVEKSFDLSRFADSLEKYFKSKLLIKDIDVQHRINKSGIFAVIVKSPIMKEIGLSNNPNDKLKIRIDIKPVSTAYLQVMEVIYSTVSKYGRTFIVQHYDLATLMSTKLAALLQRKDRGFVKGDHTLGVNYKGRDFYDMLWFMEKAVLPNEAVLKAEGIDSIAEVFDEISIRLANMDLKGIKADLLHLFQNKAELENWLASFRHTFDRLHNSRYTPKTGLELDQVFIKGDFAGPDIYRLVFQFISEKRDIVIFKLNLTYECFSDLNIAKLDLDAREIDSLIHFTNVDCFGPSVNNNADKERLKKFAQLFYEKIEQYLLANKGEIYFDKWESRVIRQTDKNFNPSKEIIISSIEQLSKVTLANLAV